MPRLNERVEVESGSEGGGLPPEARGFRGGNLGEAADVSVASDSKSSIPMRESKHPCSLLCRQRIAHNKGGPSFLTLQAGTEGGGGGGVRGA